VSSTPYCCVPKKQKQKVGPTPCKCYTRDEPKELGLENERINKLEEAGQWENYS
jgi:hypothetical protein